MQYTDLWEILPLVLYMKVSEYDGCGDQHEDPSENTD